ncbi:FAD-dependent oxidoreductase [Albidovulum sediminicola]|uniref:FAD-dependent oxidoreductase n=1 Tax=Albidovulum sediminicola TaxID=2984331 RepID=A0ABT2Z6F6_9RHOB|nr:FAD-dependent oxidoreductase [Defluviimonas sp. WL0075]MCV2866587.1 FAD-dependent oxidoreductase [Defluviimonas sp. WL0075]
MVEAGRYSLLFEPVRIGPVTARNRFYQVPHCNGLGHARPQAEAAMRAMKAEGGWAVVSNQETEIHPTSDLSPYAEGRLWDARDIPALRLMTEAVHDKGALAAIELAHNGPHALNQMSRAPILAPSDMAAENLIPRQARAMDKADIRDLRRWHRAAALRARDAGFDIVYVFAGHYMTLPHQFLLPHLNDRTDEYGGSLENRLRLTRELLEETKAAVGDRCAVALRFAVDEMLGADGMQAAEEGRAVIEMLADLPDLWDVNVAGWPNDSATTRFRPEDGYQTDYISFVKQVTRKPVVGVGRFTSPDMMVSLVKKGVLDFIGAARPSIADPFLPKKIEEGRIEEIRECIGCNICVSADTQGVPIRCTQNPTMGEEWRRGWHPEVIPPASSRSEVLVIGAGPAGLESALQLARRGHDVTLAEAEEAPGGRVLRESRLPGLGAWRRVADHRIHHLRQMGNVQMFMQSPMTAQSVAELGISHVFVASGARWRSDGVGRTTRRKPPAISARARVFTPDDIMDGRLPQGRVAVYDDDQIYLAGVLAEALALSGCAVTFVTPASVVSPFTQLTLEQARVQARLIDLGVDIRCNRQLAGLEEDALRLACVYSGREEEHACDAAVLVTERQRNVALHEALKAQGLETLELIGDAAGPGLIADAVYAGHMAARNFGRDADKIELEWFRREITSLAL